MTELLAGYLACIYADVPMLRVASARLNSDGLVFRFAKNERAKSLLAYESRLLHVIERYVTAAVPHVIFSADTFMHYSLVPGAPLYRHTLLRADSAAQDLLARELAIFLQQLHARDMSLLLVHLGRARDSLPLLTPWP